jgi:hypothetical protein
MRWSVISIISMMQHPCSTADTCAIIGKIYQDIRDAGNGYASEAIQMRNDDAERHHLSTMLLRDPEEPSTILDGVVTRDPQAVCQQGGQARQQQQQQLGHVMVHGAAAAASAAGRRSYSRAQGCVAQG